MIFHRNGATAVAHCYHSAHAQTAAVGVSIRSRSSIGPLRRWSTRLGRLGRCVVALVACQSASRSSFTGFRFRIGVGYWSVCRWSVWAVFKLVIDDVLTA
jgi:hypothetical protein